jgi:transposase
MPKILGSHNTHPAIRSFICAKSAAGLSQPEIANLVGCSVSTIKRTLRYAQERGYHEDAPRSGRPPKIDPRTIRHIGRDLDGNRRQTLQDITSTVNQLIPSPVVPRTVQRHLHHNLHMNSRVAAKKPFLTQKHRLARKEWAAEKRGWGMVDWTRIIWTDECSVEIGKSSRCIRVWRRAGERFKESCLAPTFKSGRQSLMVWSCIAYGRLGPLVLIPKDQRTGVDYVNLVLSGPLWDFYSELYEERGVVKVMEDGAPIHRAGITKTFRAQHHMEVLEHPAQSPDINPIEHAWKMLKVRVNDRPSRPKNLEELWDVLQEEWKKIGIDFINGLVSSMPERAEAVYRAQGGPTKY